MGEKNFTNFIMIMILILLITFMLKYKIDRQSEIEKPITTILKIPRNNINSNIKPPPYNLIIEPKITSCTIHIGSDNKYYYQFHGYEIFKSFGSNTIEESIEDAKSTIEYWEKSNSRRFKKIGIFDIK